MSEKDIQNSTALAAQALTQDIAEAHEAMGMIKAFSFIGKIATVAHLKTIAEIKETKKYKGLNYIDKDGNHATIANFEDFCTVCGFSPRKVYEDLQNLNYFGEEFLETSQRLGLGYREMRKLRQLPEDARAEIVEADYSEATDKEELLEKIEDLTAKHAKEKAELESKLKRKTDDYDAQSRVLDNKNKRIDQLDAELEKKRHYIDTLTPDSKGGLLRKETSQLVYGAEAILRGQVWKAFETLDTHTQESGIDHKQFMVGTLAEIELVINQLRSQFDLPDSADAEELEPWLRADYDEEATLAKAQENLKD